MTNILTLATAGLKPGQLEDTNHIQFPRVDYLQLQQHISTDILSYDEYESRLFGDFIRWIETKVRSDLFLAAIAKQKSRQFDLVFTMSERAGIPYAGMKRLGSDFPPFISMFQCWSPRQEQTITRLKLFEEMDVIIVLCQSMKQHITSLGAPEDKIHTIHFSIDNKFFTPRPETKPQPDFIFSLGEIRSRDYASLFKAVSNLRVDLLVAASGYWYAREKDTMSSTPIPDNIKISGGFSRDELRDLYARSQFVVLPIYESVYSAGATACLESACMGKAVVVTKSPGITDYVIDGETGILVPPGDVQAWREAIQWLLNHPKEAKRMGENARQRVDEELNLDNYVKQIAALLQTYNKV
jgi:glycosyltransferase involved in cell wall biosynthesis